MFVFQGELSEECKKVLGQSQLKYSSIGGWTTALLMAIVVTVIVIEYTPLASLGYLVCLLLGVGSSLPINKKSRERICPDTVTISDDAIKSSGEYFFQERDVQDIERIDDYGNYYRICFRFPHQSPVFLCQKSLLIEGTIEAFGARFAEYIVRKTNK